MLSNFQLQNRALLQSFLVGQPELRELMRSPGMQQLRQRVIASYHLGPLDGDETRAYIEHRMKQVAWKGDPRFEDAVFPLIHSYTGGIPRRINTLCTRALLAGFLSEKHAISAADVEHVIAEFSEEFGEAMAAPEKASAPVAGADANQLSELERRIISVERAMNITINLLRQLIRTPEGRSAAWTKKSN
jgi:hypothetical protein